MTDKPKVVNFPNKVEVFADLIPQELKDIPKWLCWKWEQRGDRFTKPPFRPDGERSKGAVNREDWSGFDVVVEALKTGKFSGIGFVVNDDDDITAWDFDHVLNPKNGDLVSWAEPIITALNSYTEVTPSGDGLRVFVHGDIPKDGTASKNLASWDGKTRAAVECYKDKRYTTVTGNHYPLSPLEITHKDVDKIWKDVFEKGSDPLVKRAKKNDKVKRLLNGEWEGSYGSQSEADAALCRYLAELCDGDAEKVDTLFRQSKLFRPKWDIVTSQGRTYGAATIQLAIESYSRTYRLTDTGDAKQLAKLIEGEARYCAGRWYIWDGKRFKEDIAQQHYLFIDRLVQHVAEEARNCEFDDRKKELYKHVRTLESRAKSESVLKLVQAREPIPVNIEDLDRNPYIFNCSNGIMEHGNLRPHEFGELLTKLSPVEYDPKADAPTWQRFLEETFATQEMIDYVARCVGYSATGLTIEQVIFFCHGHGANGKSTLINTVSEVFGDYARVIPSDLLIVGREQHPTGLADLRGIRMAIASEVEDGKRFNEQMIKTLTGEEKVSARRMHQDFFEFQPKCKLWIMANHKPTLRGTDYAIRRRFHLIPFSRTVEKKDQDPNLRKKLREELPGILRWMVDGYTDYMNGGLQPPAEVKAATEDYFEEMDIIGAFLREECEVGEDLTCAFNKLYERYSNFAKLRNEYLLSSKAFSAKLVEKGMKRFAGSRNVAMFKGVDVRKEQQGFVGEM